MYSVKSKFENILDYIKSLYNNVILPYFTRCYNFFINLKNCLILQKDILIKISLPIVIILAGYYACSGSQRIIKQNIKDVFSIADEIRTYYSDKPDYWHLDTNFAISNKVISAHFIKDGHILLESGTEILIGDGITAEPLMPLSQGFDIIMQNLTKAQCITYSEFQLSSEQLLGLNALHIINSNGSYDFVWGAERDLPVKKYATKDLCSDEKNTIIWSLR